MKELKTEILISSKPEMVWKTITNLSNWPKWNPIVNRLEGEFKLGEELVITMSDSKGNDVKKYKATITNIDSYTGFSFTAAMISKSIFCAERILELKETEGGTLFIQREIYSGFLVSLFWKKLKEDALPMLISMNKALKKEVEEE
ncbi:MAG: SRPBCC family protein [Candidatus Cyclobacteriaceae bacterium M2_1C_046]